MVDPDEDALNFSSGKSIYCFSGIVGISPNLEISYGYDGSFNDTDFTIEERKELAQYMINLWTQYMDQPIK